jgi:hypothetical protein
LTFQEAQQYGYAQTEKEYLRIVKQIEQEYREAYKEIENALAKLYAKMSAANVDPAQFYNYVTQYNRYTALLDEINQAYILAAKEAGKLQGQAGTLAVTNNFARQSFLLGWAGEINPILDPRVVQLSVFGTEKVWKDIVKNADPKKIAKWTRVKPPYGTLSELLANQRVQDLDRIKKALTSSLITGESYTKTAKKIRVLFNKIIYNALRVARTEGTRNLNAGAWLAAQEAEKAGIKVSRYWDATLDSRTRGRHGATDGQQEDKEGNFHIAGGSSGPYPGSMGDVSDNANCRCTVTTRPEGYEPQLRRARNPLTGETDIISYQTYEQWAKENNIKIIT